MNPSQGGGPSGIRTAPLVSDPCRCFISGEIIPLPALHLHAMVHRVRSLRCGAVMAGVGLGLGLLLGACGKKATTPAPPSVSSAPPEGAAPTASAAKPPLAPEEGGPRNWKVRGEGVNLHQEPSLSAEVITTFSAGKVLDNLGCRQADGRTWCDVQPLGGGPRGFVAAELLEPAVAPHGAVARGEDDSALRAGKGDFDATGSVPCSVAPGQPMGQCPFGVARAGGGYATVVVTRPDGMKRALFFRMGQAIGADTSEADRTGPFSATKENDLYKIQVGKERYDVVEAVIFGG